MDNLLPKIGLFGSYEFLSPFDSIIYNNDLLLCESLKTINEMISLGDTNILNNIYLKYKLTELDYENDFKNNEIIVGLVTSNGFWYFVPARYIKKIPIQDGVLYTNYILCLDLGPVPENIDLNFTNQNLERIIFKHLGINTKTNIVKALDSTLVSVEDHERINKIRNSKITYSDSDQIKILKLQEENDRLKNLIKELEKLVVKI